MFATPYTHASKRPRDEEDDDLVLGLWEDDMTHASKKPRALPFRTSPTLKHSALFSQSHSFSPRPQTLTPVDSSEDGSDDELPDHFVRGRQAPQTASSQTMPFSNSSITDDSDDDMEMEDSQPTMPPPSSWQSPKSSMCPPAMSIPNGNRMRSPPRPTISTNHSSLLSAPTGNSETGRLPTPIYGHFSHPTASSAMLGVPSVASMRMSGPISPIPASPMSPGDASEEATWWQRRRLPSPAEDQNDDDVPMSPVGMLDNMLPRLNVSPPSRPGRLSDRMAAQSESGARENTIRRSPSPFGRARSNATSLAPINTNTSSTRLSMGYKADCEKCSRRVPGHYTHIIRGDAV